MSDEPTVKIMGYADACDFLDEYGDDWACLSFGRPGSKPPDGLKSDSMHWHARFEFDDVQEHESLAVIRGGYTPPSREAVEAICDLAFDLMFSKQVLCHCAAGISRSTAAAFILWCVWLGEGKEREALRRVLTERKQALPNTLIVKYADRYMGRDGAMVEARDRLPVVYSEIYGSITG
jgi:predicted protein tyrosine phosphatase